MIEARAITKRFGAFTAVDDVSLTIEAGEFLTLLGPSGCGKTTLLRVLAGFESPDLGSVWLDGRDVTALPPYRRNLNQVFQSYALFPHLSVRDNVAFGLRMQRVSAAEQAARVAEAIGVVALGGMEGRKPDQLSGGQRQRVALARAIVCRPQVLLLDEPLSALDAKLRRGMQFELKQLQRRLGITFIFVTHDQQEALTMSDRVAVMNRGKIEQLAPPEELYRRPRTAFAADFIGQANLIPVTVAGREGNQVILRSAEGFEARLPAGAIAPDRTSVLLSVRPEKILLADTPVPGAACAFTATVEAKLFQGPTDRIALATAQGLRLQALVTGESAIKRALQPGDRIHAGIHADDLVPLEG